MNVKNNSLKILALVLAMIILISNCSFVFASNITTEEMQKSLQNVFNTKIIVKGSDSTKSTYSPMGNSVLISDSSIKLTHEKKEYPLSTYLVENNTITFTTNFADLYTALETDTSKISNEEKIQYAFVLMMLFMENAHLEFLAAANKVNIENSLAYTYLQQNIVSKAYSASGSENKLNNIDQKTNVVSLKINNENNVLTTGTFTIYLDNLAKISKSDIDSKGTTYKVYLNTLPESEKTKISEYKDFVYVKSSYNYTGKAIKPSISLGGLEKGVDYKVTYSNNKNTGLATITVTGIGDFYKGTFKKCFKIAPKGTSISKLTKAKKAFTVKWKKQATQTSGYQIQYSTNKNFKSGNKSVTITNTKTTSKKISKLKAKKKYYVRIRTFKKFNGKKYYSSWSKVKNVTTKR